jgi:hypothetical protein
MTPQQLVDACVGQVNAFNAGELVADAPFISLVVMRDKPPTGETVRLFGRYGPRGRIANCQHRGGKWKIVAYFNPAEILKDLSKEFGFDVTAKQPAVT